MELDNRYIPGELVTSFGKDLKSLVIFALTNTDAYRILNSPESYQIIKLKYQLPTFTNLREAIKYNRDNLHNRLVISIGNNDLDSVIRMVEYGAPISKDTMAKAAKSGNLEMVKYLVTNIKDDYWSNIEKAESIKHAAETGNLEIVKYLVASTEYSKIHIQEAISYAASRGHLDVIKYLVTLGKYNLTQAINSAVKGGYLEIVKYLVNLGGIIDEDEAITFAVVNNHLDVVKYLLEKFPNRLDYAIRRATAYNRNMLEYLPTKK